MQVLPYLKAALFLIAIGVAVWLLVAAFEATEATTYVNQTASPLRFTAYRVDEPRYFTSQVVVPAHGEQQVQLPRNAPALRVIATRPDGSVAFEHTYAIGDLDRVRHRVVVTPVPSIP